MSLLPALLSATLVSASIFLAGLAHADKTTYRSAHPIPEEQAGFFCHIEAKHTHTYTPAADLAAEFVAHNAGDSPQLEFVGDPTILGYEGPVASYAAKHPLHFAGGIATTAAECQIEGTHFHLRAPLDPSLFEDREGTYYFGSYKQFQEERRERRKLARTEKKRERREARKKKSSERRSGRVRAKARSKKKPTIESPTLVTATTVSVAPPIVKPVKKPKKSSFRSWMNRRRGR